MTQVIPDGPDDDVAFLENKEGRAPVCGRGNGTPKVEQVVEIPLQFFGAAAYACRADDDAHAFGQFEGFQCIPELDALIALDAAADATGARVVGHQHHVTPGKTDERGQGCALAAALFFLYLNDDLLAFPHQIADFEPRLAVISTAGKVLARDFLKWQEPVSLRTEVHESGFEAGLYAGYSALVDVGLGRDPVAVLDIKIV